jgi:cytochrome c oxidase cbb3-type subunit 3
MNSLRTYIQAGMVALLTAVISLLPQQASASNALVNGTGLSDESLFIILAVIAIFQVIAILVIAGVIKSIVGNQQVWQNRWNKGAGVITLLLVMIAGQSQAAEADFDALVSMNDTGFMALVTLNIFLFFAFIYLAFKLNGLMKMLMKDEEGKVPETFMDKINVLLTDAVPVDKEDDVLMDHEYDGIHELDNNLPPWWLYGFYFTIVFGLVYLVNYHITGSSPLQAAEYQAEIEAAEAAKAAFVATQENTIDESNVALLTEASDLAAGQKTFKLYCAPCHAEHGGSLPGGVGPNLTDDYWLHGGSVTDIFKTIKYGVPEKGMVSWQAQLNPSQIQQLASFIKSIKGSNPDNAKEPQGDLWQDEETSETQPTTEESPADTLSAPSEEDLTLVD